MNKLVVVTLVTLLVMTSTVSMTFAKGNNETNATDASHATVTANSNSATNTSTAVTGENKVVTTKASNQLDGVLRQPPTVSLYTVNPTVDKDKDAIFQAYFDNPAVNGVIMNVEVMAQIPNGVSMRSVKEILMGGAGIYKSSYTLKPGENMFDEYHVICNEPGEYPITVTATYYLDGNKDRSNTVNLVETFHAKEPSTEFHLSDNGTGGNLNTDNERGLPLSTTNIELIGGFVLIALFVALLRR